MKVSKYQKQMKTKKLTKKSQQSSHPTSTKSTLFPNWTSFNQSLCNSNVKMSWTAIVIWMWLWN